MKKNSILLLLFALLMAVRADAQVCAGTPTPGITLSNAGLLCPSTAAFTLSAQNATPGTDITYQWQTSPNGTTWTNATGTGNTSATYTTTQTATTYYRVNVTCPTSTQVGTSTPSKIASVCYCSGTNSTGCGSGDVIKRVKFGTLDNASTCATGTGAFTDFAGTAGIPSLNIGGTYSLSITGGPGGTEVLGMWIDFDQNGTFDASEYFGVPGYTSTTTDQTVATNILIPGSAKSGFTKMRVRIRNGATVIAATEACTAFTKGETEDYDINMICPTPVLSALPASVTACATQTTSFSTTATNSVSLQWQVSTDGGTTWSNIVNNTIYSGATTNTLGLTNMVPAMHNNQYRVVATGICGNTVNSNASVLIFNSQIVISAQPANTAGCVTKNSTISVTATGGALSYQWQVSTNSGGTWTDLTNAGVYSGVTTNAMTITAATSALNNNQYRALVYSTCFSVYTNAATLTVNPLIAITTQPSPATACVSGNASFTTAATGTGISYQWQVSTDNAVTWNNVTNTAPYSGATTGTLNITAAPATMDAYQYRAVVSSTAACATSVNTSAVLLQVTNLPRITTQPVNTAVCLGNNATISIAVATNGNTYQWQTQISTAPFWVDLTNTAPYSGVTTATLTITSPTMALNNTNYRCQVKAPCSAPLPSQEVALTIRTAPSITTQPSPADVCTSVPNVSFGVVATGTSLTYQWQVSTTGVGGTFANVSGGMYYNPTSPTLTISFPPASINGYAYRCVVSGACTPVVNSTPALLTVRQAPVITTHPVNFDLCSGNAKFFVAAIAQNISYQWQQYNGSTYVNMVNNASFTGVTTDTLTVVAPTVAQNTAVTNRYRCVVSSTTCTPAAISGIANHFVSTVPTITIQPLPSTICDGGSTIISFTSSFVTRTNVPIFKWQMSTDAGVTWADVVASSNYSQETTGALKVSNGNVGMEGYLFRCIVSTACGSVTTNASRLSVSLLPIIGLQPKDITVCPGTPAVFTGSATGTNITYQWQVDMGSGFVNIPTNSLLYAGIKTNTLTVASPTVAMNSYVYRLVANGNCTPSANSSSAVLTVYNPVSIRSQTGKDTACETSNHKMGARVAGNGLFFQWQLQTSPGVYTDIANVSPYSGVNTDSLRINGVPLSFSENVYRLYITEKILCNLKFYTNDIPLHVTAAPVTAPAKINATEGSSATYYVPTTGASYQWQENARGTGFADITDPTQYDGINNDTLTINNVTTAMNGNLYRCIVDGVCVTTVASTPSVLLVDGLSVKNVSASGISMSVYPNPLAGNQLSISFSKKLTGKTDVRVMDKMGRLVYHNTITTGQANTASIELNALAAGVYMLQVNNESGNFNQTVQFTKQ